MVDSCGSLSLHAAVESTALGGVQQMPGGAELGENAGGHEIRLEDPHEAENPAEESSVATPGQSIGVSRGGELEFVSERPDVTVLAGMQQMLDAAELEGSAAGQQIHAEDPQEEDKFGLKNRAKESSVATPGQASGVTRVEEPEFLSESHVDETVSVNLEDEHQPLGRTPATRGNISECGVHVTLSKTVSSCVGSSSDAHEIHSEKPHEDEQIGLENGEKESSVAPPGQTNGLTRVEELEFLSESHVDETVSVSLEDVCKGPTPATHDSISECGVHVTLSKTVSSCVGSSSDAHEIHSEKPHEDEQIGLENGAKESSVAPPGQTNGLTRVEEPDFLSESHVDETVSESLEDVCKGPTPATRGNLSECGVHVTLSKTVSSCVGSSSDGPSRGVEAEVDPADSPATLLTIHPLEVPDNNAVDADERHGVDANLEEDLENDGDDVDAEERRDGDVNVENPEDLENNGDDVAEERRDGDFIVGSPNGAPENNGDVVDAEERRDVVVNVVNPVEVPDDIGDDVERRDVVVNVVNLEEVLDIGDDVERLDVVVNVVNPEEVPDIGDDVERLDVVVNVVNPEEVPDIGDDVERLDVVVNVVNPVEVPDIGDDVERLDVVVNVVNPEEVSDNNGIVNLGTSEDPILVGEMSGEASDPRSFFSNLREIDLSEVDD